MLHISLSSPPRGCWLPWQRGLRSLPRGPGNSRSDRAKVAQSPRAPKIKALIDDYWREYSDTELRKHLRKILEKRSATFLGRERIRAGPCSERRGAGPLFPLFPSMLMVGIFFAKPIKPTDGPNSRGLPRKMEKSNRIRRHSGAQDSCRRASDRGVDGEFHKKKKRLAAS